MLILTLAVSCLLLTGCGSKDEVQTEDTLSVALVVPEAFGDKSFNDSAREGVEKLKAEFDINVKYIECRGEDVYEQNLRNAAEDADFVVAIGWQFWMIDAVVGDYPDVKFIWCDNAVENPQDYENLLCVTYAQNEGSFLAGYIAANLTKNGVVGAVGGEDSDTINDFIVGYEQGAKYFDETTEVKWNYSNDYDDASIGKDCALALYDTFGADVIFQIAGNAGSGVFAAAEEKGFIGIGVDQDQKISIPAYEKVIACSMVKEVGLSIHDAIKAFIENGTWNGGKIWVADMQSGYVGIGYGEANQTQLVSDSIKANVEALRQEIVAGNIQVATTR